MKQAFGLLSILYLWFQSQPIPAGNEHPHFKKGGASNLTNTIDSVNLQNGNGLLKIPLGPVYEVGPVMSFQTHLYYNSKVWQTVETGLWSDLLQGEVLAKPSDTANAGIGFSVNPPGGKLLGPSQAYNAAVEGHLAWIYEDGDGGRHYLYPQQREDRSNAGYYYSWDGSNIRAYISDFNNPVNPYVELPNGIKVSFFNANQYVDTPEGAAGEDHRVWWPSRMEDRFAVPNYLNFDYSPMDGAGVFTVDMSDRLGRHWTFTYKRYLFDTPALQTLANDDDFIVAFRALNITMPGYGGHSLSFDFEYADLLTAPACNYLFFSIPDGPTAGVLGDFPALDRLVLPDPDGNPGTDDRQFYEFEYYEWSDFNYTQCRHGALKTVTLPHRGKIKWEYEIKKPQGMCTYNNGDPNITDLWFPGRTPWVTAREYLDENGTVSARWEYLYRFSIPSLNTQDEDPVTGSLDPCIDPALGGRDPDKRRTNETMLAREIDSLGNRHYYFFSNWDWTHDSHKPGHPRAGIHAPNWTDYGLPYLKSNLIPWLGDDLVSSGFIDDEDLICDSQNGDCTTDTGDPNGRYLSSLHFKYIGPDSTGTCEVPSNLFRFCATGQFYDLERSEFVKYEVERNAMHELPPQDQTDNASGQIYHVLWPGGSSDKRAKMVSSRTVVYNDRTQANWEKVSDFSDFDKLNQPRMISVNEQGIVDQSYQMFTATLDAVADHPADPNPANRQPWILGLYTQKWEQQGGKRFKQEASFDSDTGLLERRRILASTSTGGLGRQGKDLLTVNEYGDYGLILWKKRYGGDLQPFVPTDGQPGSLNLTGLTPEYKTQFGYDANGHLISETLHGVTQQGGNVSLRQYLESIDKNTGLVASHTDVSEVVTGFGYDRLGRITSIDKSPDLGETYAYHFYPLENNPSQQRRVAVMHLPGSDNTTTILVDGLGRNVQVQEDFPGGKTAKVLHQYTSGGTSDGYPWRSSMPFYTTAASWQTVVSRNSDGTPNGVRSPDGKTHFTSQSPLVLTEWSDVASDAPEWERGFKELSHDFRGRVVHAVIRTTRCEEACNPGQCNPSYCDNPNPPYDNQRTPFTYAYDAGGHLSGVFVFGATLRGWNYDGRGFLQSETRWDKADVHQVAQNGLLATSITYGGYDSLGNPGWMLEAKHPDGGWTGESSRKTIHTYDPFGRLHKVETDVQGGPYPGQSLVEEYNYYGANSGSNLGKGKLESVKRVNYTTPEADPSPVTITEIYTYAGGRGRLSKTVTAINRTEQSSGILLEQSYDYDAAGQLTGYEYPHFVSGAQAIGEATRSLGIAYDKTKMVDLTTAVGGGPPISLFADTANPKIEYHANGVPERTHWRNGVQHHYQLYHGTTRPSSIAISGGSEDIDIGPYQFDSWGNTYQKGANSYGYDTANRLISARIGGVTRRYWYTKFGAIEKITEQEGGTTETLLDLEEQYWNDMRIANVAYDPWGNMAHTPVPQMNVEFYYYDPLNMPRKRLLAVSESDAPNAPVVEYRHQFYFYGPNRERFALSPWVAQDGASHTALITVRDTQNRVVREYTLNFNPTTWRLKRDYVYVNKNGFYSYDYETGQGQYHHQDELGNVVAITDATTGAVVETFEYWPFGEELVPPPEPEEFRHKFTGHERDFPDQDYMHARYYKPALGRFASLDPGPMSLDDPQSWNKYVYAGNNPLMYVDPDGRAAQFWAAEKTGVAVAVTAVAIVVVFSYLARNQNVREAVSNTVEDMKMAYQEFKSKRNTKAEDNPYGGERDDRPENADEEVPSREDMDQKTDAQKKKEMRRARRENAEDQFRNTEEFQRKKGNRDVMESNKKSEQNADEALRHVRKAPEDH